MLIIRINSKKWELLISEENKSLGCQSEAYFGRNGSTFGVREEEGRGATWVLSPQDKKCALFILHFNHQIFHWS